MDAVGSRKESKTAEPAEKGPLQPAGSLGPYTLFKRIGRGGMAEIWLANLRGVEGFEKPLVLKRILPEYAKRRAFIKMFIREAKLSSSLHHANIVQIYELGEIGGEYFIAMEYIRGYDLLRLLHRAAVLKVPLRPALAVFIAAEALRGLAYAHAAKDARGNPLGIVHMDVSPSNILIGDDGAVKLSDFGVARASFERGGATTLRGKLGYMSPEQIGGAAVDPRSDIFAAGILLYEMLTLKRLFRGRTSVQTMANVRAADIEPKLKRHPEIPKPVQAILRKALARSPEQRYQTAEAMGEDLQAFLFDARVRVSARTLSKFVEDLFGRAVPEELAEPAPTATESQPWNAGVDRTGSLIGSARMQVNDEKKAPSARRVMLSRMKSARFVFREQNGEPGAPMPYNTVLRLILSKAVSPDAMVSVDGSEWRPLREVASLTDTLARAYPRTEGEEPIDAGFFDRYHAAEILARIAGSEETGALRLVREGAKKEVFFIGGRVAGITASRKDELLGPFLVAQGAINGVQLQVAYSKAGTLDGPIGDALVKLGFIDSGTLYRLVHQLLRERFMELFSWRSGHCAFYFAEKLRPDLPLELDPLPALAEGVRRHLSVDAIEGFFGRLGNPRMHLASDPPFPVDRLRLRSAEYRVFRELDGPARNTGAIIRVLVDPNDPESRRTVLSTLFILHQTGHLRTVAPLPSGW